MTGVLDFNPQVGMRIEGDAPAQPETEPWRVIVELAPGFGGAPPHTHRHSDESFQVLEGTLDLLVDGRWHELGPGEPVTVPKGKPHTVRNLHVLPVRAVNVHTPALDYPDFMATLHALVSAENVRGLPPRDARSVLHLALLYTEHGRAVTSASPPRFLMGALGRVARVCGYRLPEAVA
jgi:hypothetical protein